VTENKGKQRVTAMEKKNFNLYDRVMLKECNELSGLVGTILGRSFVDVFDGYIVLLDENRWVTHHYPVEMKMEYAAISIPEGCLELIHDLVVNDVQLDTVSVSYA
jgi:hypothetical protein